MEINNDKKLRLAVVGLGKMGLLHASLLSVLPNVELVAVCDKSGIMRKVASKALKDTRVTDSLDPFSDMNLDAIYVTTPIPSHYGIIKEVYSKKIASNLFVEKTLSSSSSRSEELLKLAQSSQSITMVGYMKRFSVTFRKAKELLGQLVLGELLSFNAYAFSSDFASVHDDSSASIARGGVLVDLGAHVVDLALWFFGDLRVASASVQSYTGVGAVDSVDFKVNDLNNVEGSFNVSWIKEGYRMPEFGLTIKGSKGILTVDDSRVKLELNNSESTEWYRQDLSDNVRFLLAEPEYSRENESFIGSLVSGIETEPNFKTALKVDNLLGDVGRKANGQ
jgi:predicted dehydrogenase